MVFLKHVNEHCAFKNLIIRSIEPHQELCKKLHNQIDLVDEERYDAEGKVSKSSREVGLCTLNPLRALQCSYRVCYSKNHKHC